MADILPHAPDYWQLQQGDKYGGLNCSAYEAAAAVFYDTGGQSKPTGAQIRAWSNEPKPDPKSPGLNLAQLAAVIKSHYNLVMTVRLGMSFDEAMEINQTHAMVLSVGYRPLRASSYRGSTQFGLGHALFLARARLTYDSLADGRRSGIFRGPAVYPYALLKAAAGDLPVEMRNGVVIRRAGYGKAWVGYMPKVHPLGGVAPQPPAGGIVIGGPQFTGGDVAIARGGLNRIDSGYVLKLVQGQPVFQQAGSTDIRTKMSQAGSVPYVGSTQGWYAVEINTSSRYADGVARPTILYVPPGVGKPVAVA